MLVQENFDTYVPKQRITFEGKSNMAMDPFLLVKCTAAHPRKYLYKARRFKYLLGLKYSLGLWVCCRSEIFVYNGRMFETNAELKMMFSSFRHLTTTAELRSNKLLESHAMKVICIIDDTISNLDDMDYVIKLLQQIAHTHCQQFPYFDSEYFWVCELLCGRPIGRIMLLVRPSVRPSVPYGLVTPKQET